jgi:chromate transporter
VLIALSWIYMAWGHLPAIAGIMDGIKPAVVAIVLAAAWRIGSRTLRNGLLVGVALAAFIAIDVLGVPFPLIVLGAAAVGLAGGRVRPALFDLGSAHATAPDGTPHPPALIDDTTPTPAHARFSWHRLATVGAAGCAIGLAGWSALALVFGPDGELPRMGAFFGRMALMTFGGAYAVLPYVVQHAVEQYHWLDAGQMIDGLALGETTPGPLIMIVAFVGFVGGWSHALFGPGARFLAGAAAAGVVFTFLPSFVFILAGGPLVESTRGDVRLTAPLTAISAAVVGVIASLAVFFGAHVFVAHGAPRWDAIAIAAAAAVALLRYRTGTIKTILACALAGLLLSYWHG